MNNLRNIIFLIVIIVFPFTSCTKDKEDNFSVNSYKEYMPMHLNDVHFYRLDSVLPTAFGQAFNTISYIAKDTVVAQRLDAVGDTTFDVSRFVTDTLQTGPWKLATAYQVVYTKNTCDVIQADGKRFIKLTTPVRDNYTWDGNQYFMTGKTYDTNDPDYIYFNWGSSGNVFWTYAYDSVGAPYQTMYKSYDNSVLVNEVNNVQTFDPSSYNQTQYAQEVYAKGAGLIYQNMLFYTYQPPPSSGYDLSSFGVKLTAIQ